MNNSKPSPFEQMAEDQISNYNLDYLEISSFRKGYWNLSTAGYIQESIYRKEGLTTKHGALVVLSGERTSRSAKDKFIVREPGSESDISWGEYNAPYDGADFERVFNKMKAHLMDKDIFIQDGFAGASPNQQMSIRVISTQAWQGLFARNMFITDSLPAIAPEFTILSLPEFAGDPV